MRYYKEGIGKKMGLLLVLLVIMSLGLSTSSTPLHNKPFLSEPLQENNLGVTGTHEHGISSNDDGSKERSGIVHSSKFGHGSVYGGARGGGATGGADNGADVQGGRAVVPVIIAGAANNNHPKNHHNAGSRHGKCNVLPTLITTTLAALIVH